MQNVYFIETTKMMSIAAGALQNFSNFLAAKDQYGVTFSLAGIDVFYMTTNTNVITVDNAADTFTLVASGTCTLKAYFPATDRTLEMIVNVTN